MGLLGHYVSKQGLGNLSKYGYHGVDNSLVAKYIMQPFWIRAVQFLPIWMAPNLVTLIGFVFILISYGLTSVYHPYISSPLSSSSSPLSPSSYGGPAWLYLFNAVSMFIYQSMDALDGKQARRTGSSSPLGELFDHGCDAVTTVVGALTLGSALGVDLTLCLVTLILMMMAFYCAQWEEYYTGTLTLGYIGVTEAQIGAMGIYLISFFCGVQWWDQEFQVAGWAIRYGSVPFLVSAASMFPTALSNFQMVFKYHSNKPGLLGALANTAPVFVLSGGFFLWAQVSPLYFARPHAFLLTYGFLVSNLVGRIVLDRVCMERFRPLQPLVLPLLVAPFLIHSQWESAFLTGYCVLAVGSYFHFALSVINDLCATLKIRCLSLEKISVVEKKK